MVKNPKISVIVPSYKTAEYIPACLDSVLAQTFTDYEVVCINDGSPDNALDIFRQYAKRDKRIRVMTQKNQGVCTAKNNAISAARGEYIFPLDSDDIIAPNCLEVLYNIITKNEFSVVCPGAILFGRGNHIWKLPPVNHFNMYGGRVGVHNSSLFPKKLWKKYGGYCTDLNRLGGEDHDFWLCFLDDNKKIFRTKTPLFFYRIKPTDQSRNTGGNATTGQEIRKIKLARHPRIRFWHFMQYVRNPFRGIRETVRAIRRKRKNK